MLAMAGRAKRWTLENLIDLEQALAADVPPSATLKAAVLEAARGLEGAEARRAGLRVWLDAVKREPSAGRRFSAAFSMVAFLTGLLALLAGMSGVLGLLDRSRGGIDVVLFLGVLIGVQWSILAFATVAWLFRHRAGEGFSGLQALLGKLIRRFAGEREDGWWRRLMDGGGAPRAALLWRLARLAQGAGICFNLGIIGGLAGLVLVRNVGFFWETTTETAMRDGLLTIVHTLSLPWSALWPAAAPDAAVIDATRWLPQRSGALPPGPSAWWSFLLLTTFCWGLMPRLILWFLAGNTSKAALAKMDFQGRHHRTLWRQLTGIDRVEADEKPLDGVLVLDVGGSGLEPESLRPFLLQKLRVHPAAWHPVAVLDPGAEAEASAALALAPAGVVLLAEGWALSPPRMTALHSQIRAAAGPRTPVKFLIANEAGDQPAAVTEDERKQWERFVDSLRDPFAEVFFY